MFAMVEAGLSLDKQELKGLFLKWCSEKGVKRFLFDLDDTICPTRQVFVDAISDVCDLFAKKLPFNTSEEWKLNIETVNNRLFESVSVNPARWSLLLDELGSTFPFDRAVRDEAQGIFDRIYTTPIDMFEKAAEGLESVRSAGLSIGVVTHANEAWTWRKYKWLSLVRFVEREEVYIVDENEHKTAESWRGAVEYFNLTPGQCAIVGDSPRSDINPACEIGIEHCFLVETSERWSVHDQSVDKVVIKIQNLSQIPGVVLGK